MGKFASPSPKPGHYRDDPDRDDAASTSSAVPMENIDYPEADLPAYEDVPAIPSQAHDQFEEGQSYLIHPSLPDSHLSRDETTTTTHWPLYSQDPDFLRSMLQKQAQYPPTFTVRVIGTHTETTRNKDKTDKVDVTDFDVRVDMTYLLVPGSNTLQSLKSHELKTAAPGKKVYRGLRTKNICHTESAPDCDSYIQSYVSSPFPVRSFTLQRRIDHHDSNALEALIRSLVGSTNYRGHINISFPVTHNKVTVYSPCWQNTSREKLWLRWIFYLTFLWIFSWPYLWYITRRWEVVTVVFPYSTSPDAGVRKFVTKSEAAFFDEWKASLRRAILGKKQGWLDEEYKTATVEASFRGEHNGLPGLPSTGNAVADGAMGFLQQASVMGRNVNRVGGWGADSS